MIKLFCFGWVVAGLALASAGPASAIPVTGGAAATQAAGAMLARADVAQVGYRPRVSFHVTYGSSYHRPGFYRPVYSRPLYYRPVRYRPVYSYRPVYHRPVYYQPVRYRPIYVRPAYYGPRCTVRYRPIRTAYGWVHRPQRICRW